ncbi:MAG: hypothetical protein IKU75_01795 [Butyricimonas sp.]|nr:hypothetical protein [Butyricimonas sp.]
MSFIAKNPLTAPEVESSPFTPRPGTRGLFAGKDGWNDVDSKNNVRKIAIVERYFVNILGGEDNWSPENVLDANGNIIGVRYGQVVDVINANITPNSKVDLQISSEQMVIFHEKDLAFVAENEDCTVTIYCIGNIPENDYRLQATVTEVV